MRLAQHRAGQIVILSSHYQGDHGPGGGGGGRGGRGGGGLGLGGWTVLKLTCAQGSPRPVDALRAIL